MHILRELRDSPQRDAEIFAANSLYFPIAQYVAAHWGDVASGVRLNEIVHIEEAKEMGLGRLQESIGEGDLHAREEAEAALGNSDAMLWLARRYFWGYGGVEPNIEMARYWFERAAENNNPEGS
jgi:TPR repeat protein